MINRVIEEAEVASVAASLIRKKAALYANASPKGMNDPKRAITLLEKALQNSRIREYANDQISWLQADLCRYWFQTLAGRDDRKANTILKQALQSGLDRQIDWNFLIAYSLQTQRSPDYELLLALADKSIGAAAIASSRAEPYNRAEAMAVKGDVYTPRDR